VNGVGEGIEYDEWVQGWGGLPDGEVIADEDVYGEHGRAGVYIVDTGEEYCVVVVYSDEYLPSGGDEYYYTKDLGRAVRVFLEALEETRDYIEEVDSSDDDEW